MAREVLVAQIDGKKSWWEEHGGEVIFAAIIGIAIVWIAAANYHDPEPDATPYPCYVQSEC
jgi:predicted negative regulator of RcsB-dependent stress response